MMGLQLGARDMARMRNLNLNLLMTFDAIMKERHVSRAAAKIGVTQPALSYDLRKLRLLFNDVLFIRGPSGFEPTARAQEIHESVRAALAQIQSVVEGCDAFDPSTAHRSFGIALTDAVTFELVPPLVRQLRRLAPRVHIRVENAGTEDSCALLLSGMVDLAIITETKLPPGIVGREIFRDSMICVADRTNPQLHNGRLTRDAFAQASHVLVSADRRIGTHAGSMFRARGIDLNVIAALPHWRNVPEVVRGTDLIGMMRERLVTRPNRDPDLVYFSPPLEMPQLSFRQVWPERSGGDPGHRWFRDLMYATEHEQTKQMGERRAARLSA